MGTTQAILACFSYLLVVSMFFTFVIADMANEEGQYNELGFVVNKSTDYNFTSGDFDASTLGTSPVDKLNDYTNHWKYVENIGLVSTANNPYLFIHRNIPTANDTYDHWYYINNTVNSDFEIYANTHSIVGYEFDGIIISLFDNKIKIYEPQGWVPTTWANILNTFGLGGAVNTGIFKYESIGVSPNVLIRTVTTPRNFTVYINDMTKPYFSMPNIHAGWIGSEYAIFCGVHAHDGKEFTIERIKATTYYSEEPGWTNTLFIVWGIVAGFDYSELLPVVWNIILIKLPALLLLILIGLAIRGVS